MQIQHVAIASSAAARAASVPELTPEMLAVVGARYSRNKEGLAKILALIDKTDPEKSIDRIFNMVDYGHASIGDMAPIALFMDDVSLLQIYQIWAACPLAAGQESSTRYISYSDEGQLSPASSIVPAELAGIPLNDRNEWEAMIGEAFKHYDAVTSFWRQVAEEAPDSMRLPPHLLREAADNPASKAARTVERMQRNFIFDRARYFLPAAARNNFMLLMRARNWIELCQNLLSQPIPEACTLGEKIREQMDLVTTRLTKHARATEDWKLGHEQDFAEDRTVALKGPAIAERNHPSIDLDVVLPSRRFGEEIDVASDLEHHPHRYSRVGRTIKRAHATFSIDAVSFAELRDLNRHRTGNKFSPFVPTGFYGARDQIPPAFAHRAKCLDDAIQFGIDIARKQRQKLIDGDVSHGYWALLGTQFPFEHGTQMDKLIYEIELRTGTGAHWRYAEHYREIHDILVRKVPELKNKILVGSAEPE